MRLIAIALCALCLAGCAAGSRTVCFRKDGAALRLPPPDCLRTSDAHFPPGLTPRQL